MPFPETGVNYCNDCRREYGFPRMLQNELTYCGYCDRYTWTHILTEEFEEWVMTYQEKRFKNPGQLEIDFNPTE